MNRDGFIFRLFEIESEMYLDRPARELRSYTRHIGRSKISHLRRVKKWPAR